MHNRLTTELLVIQEPRIFITVMDNKSDSVVPITCSTHIKACEL